jgi:polyhydroxyalkanoate synthesis regulator phasin
MVTLLKKAVFVGLGATERAKDILEDLSKKGEQSQSDSAKQIKSFFEFSERVEAECNQKIGDVIKRVSTCVRVPSLRDIERLEKEIANLADQVHRGKQTSSETVVTPDGVS